MPYGTIKVDTITFTAGGADTSVSISGLVQNPTFTGNITTTGTVTAATVVGTTTVSGATVTGTQAQFTVITGGTAGFTTITGTTVTGTTANFATVSGTTVTGTTGNFGGTVTAATVVGTTTVSGATVTGNAGSFTTVTGGVATITSGVFATGAEALPSISFSSDPNTGIYSPGADQVAISTNGTQRLYIDSTGNIGVGTTTKAWESGQFFAVQFGKGGSVFGRAAGDEDRNGFASNAYHSSTGWKYIASSAHATRYDHSDGNHIWYYAGTGTADASVTFSEAMRIDTSGRLGLGTSSPVHALHVVGNSLVTGVSYVGASRASQTGFSKHINIEGTDCSLQLYQTTTGSSWEIGNDNTGLFRILNGGTDRFVINSSGRVGIGTTPDVSLHVATGNATGYIKIDGGTFANATNGLQFRSNSNGYSAEVSHFQNSLSFYTAGSEAMKIDSSRRLLVGTSTTGSSLTKTIELHNAGTSTSQPAFQVYSYPGTTQNNSGYFDFYRSRGSTLGTNTIVAADDTLGYLRWLGANGTGYDVAAQIIAQVDGTPGASSDMPGRLVFSTTADGASSPTERMRIDNVGNTTNFTSGTYGFTSKSSLAAGTTDVLFGGVYSATSTTTGGTLSFEVFTNGNVVNTNNSYGSLSDLKLKENIVDASSQWDDLKALQVRNYNFKEGQTHTQIGLIAQEVELVSPGLVSESPDRDTEGNDLGTVTKSVNYSVLYMKAVKALQEAMERIEQLETEMAEVKAQLQAS